jgi:excisionase family DNA binding protein
MDRSSSDLPQYLKPKEFAAIINVTPEAVRSWIFRRRIPVQRFGRAVRIRREVAEKIIREGL